MEYVTHIIRLFRKLEVCCNCWYLRALQGKTQKSGDLEYATPEARGRTSLYVLPFLFGLSVLLHLSHELKHLFLCPNPFSVPQPPTLNSVMLAHKGTVTSLGTLREVRA